MALGLQALRLPPDDGLGNRPGNTHGDSLKHLGFHFTLVPTFSLSDIVSDLGNDSLCMLFATSSSSDHQRLVAHAFLSASCPHIVEPMQHLGTC